MNDSGLEGQDDGDGKPSGELAAAIERARQKTASHSMVESLTTRVFEQTKNLEIQVAPKSNRAVGIRWSYWVIALAASIALITSLRYWQANSDEQVVRPSVELITMPIYSNITTVSLTRVGYRQVEEDLNRTDAKIEEASEGLHIAFVRQEIQKTLEEFYNWSE